MSKSKNASLHNQGPKAHANGIKKPRKHYHSSTKGVRNISLLHPIFYPVVLTFLLLSDGC